MCEQLTSDILEMLSLHFTFPSALCTVEFGSTLSNSGGYCELTALAIIQPMAGDALMTSSMLLSHQRHMGCAFMSGIHFWSNFHNEEAFAPHRFIVNAFDAVCDVVNMVRFSFVLKSSIIHASLHCHAFASLHYTFYTIF